MITHKILDLPCGLKSAKLFDALDWKVSSFDIMSLNHLRCNNQAQLSSHLWRSCYQKIQFPIFQKMYDSIKARSSVWCNLMYIVFALWSSENLIKSHSSIGHVVTRKVRS